MPPNSNNVEKPWYREFWAWFVFAPLIIVIIACVITVTIAFTHRQDVVVDDYYKVGKMINQSFDADTRAAELAVEATVIIDNVSAEILVRLNSKSPLKLARLTLDLSHPAESDRDQHFELNAVSVARWRQDIDHGVHGRHYVRLSAFDDQGQELWRLHGEHNFSASRQLVLLPEMHRAANLDQSH